MSRFVNNNLGLKARFLLRALCVMILCKNVSQVSQKKSIQIQLFVIMTHRGLLYKLEIRNRIYIICFIVFGFVVCRIDVFFTCVGLRDIFSRWGWWVGGVGVCCFLLLLFPLLFFDVFVL